MSELSQPVVIAIGGILHETHTFMEQPTTLADFEAGSLYRGDQLLAEMGGTRSGIGGMIDAAAKEGWQLSADTLRHCHARGHGHGRGLSQVAS